MQTKNWKSKQYTPKSKIANEGYHSKHERNNPMTFKLNNVYYRNINVKSRK